MPLNSEDGFWTVIEDFDPTTSRANYCSVSGLPKRETDVGVFRPIVNGQIAFEGYFDISQYAVEQAARLLEWLSPEEAGSLRERIAVLEEQIETVRKEAFKKAQDAVKMAGVRAAAADL